MSAALVTAQKPALRLRLGSPGVLSGGCQLTVASERNHANAWSRSSKPRDQNQTLEMLTSAWRL